ncbi:hypothetical protein CPB85DRAFT_208266 [Mucidula mucida]|nr:hypothetical protein CPB85DRAFT_208266 [Mucidula mucida]
MDAAGNRACQYCVRHSATSPHFPPTTGYIHDSNSPTPNYALSSHGGSYPRANVCYYPKGPPPSQGHLTLSQNQWAGQYPQQGYDPLTPAPPGSMPVTNGYSHMAFPAQQSPYAFPSRNEIAYMRSAQECMCGQPQCICQIRGF